MAEISKPLDINKIWSETGDNISPSDTKISAGWAVEIPPRQWFNWLDHKQDQAIAHINQHGIAVWDAATEYQAGKSYVQGSNGKIYIASQTNTNNNPTTSPAFWQEFGRNNRVKFTSSGSFTVPPGVTTIWISAVAGGGGGGSSLTVPANFIQSGAGGGGAGQAINRVGFSVTPGQVLPVTIGAGGNGGAAGGANGSPGGTTSVGGLVTLTGGSGGILSNSIAIPGIPNNSAGGAGFPAGEVSATVVQGSGGRGGQGGSTPFGPGGFPSPGTNGGSTGGGLPAGQLNTGAGGGGSGGSFGTSGASGAAGGAGSNGLVFIEW